MFSKVSSSLFLALALFLHGSSATIPQVDFDRMGTVGLAGAFAGLDFFSNNTVAFDPTSSTLFSRASDGSLTRLASTNSGGSILAGCLLKDVFYLAGEFSSINGSSISNIASFNPSTQAFAALASGGPNGKINALFCDDKDNTLWVGGLFSSPGSSIAVYDTNANSWSAAPFKGVSGAQAEINSITTNSSDTSLFFAGSFVTSFGTGNVILNGTNNPNVPFSAGASLFSSSLVPVPLENANVNAPGTSEAGFNDINNILCPAGPDGSGNSWFAANTASPKVIVQTGSFISSSGIRLGNTFQPDHGTTGFSVTTLPDNAVRQLHYLDPTTGVNNTCTDPCPLSVDSSILYQDFLFDGPLAITGVQITLSQFTGSSPGLHILQILSSGAFASSIDTNNVESCFAPNPSNTTKTGQWISKVVNTNIPATVQTVLTSEFPVDTSSDSASTFTWIPYVSAAGNYDINLLVPGCTALQDCPLRTSVKVTVFPGPGLNPFITTVSQQNTNDATVLLYSGPILPSSPDFVTTVHMALADKPAGTGQNGNYEIVADRVQMILKSATPSASANATANSTSGAQVGEARGFGFLEWPRSTQNPNPSVDGTKIFPNSTLTALDTVGFSILSGIGGTTSLTSQSSINAVVHHPSAIFVGGAFSISSGPASGTSNIASFKAGALAALADGGLNGEVSSFILNGDQLFVGGSFTDTGSVSQQGRLGGVALYDVQKNTWSPLLAGVNGNVTSLGLTNNQLQVVGNFTQIRSLDGSSGTDASGFAVWDIKTGTWVSGGGLLIGNMTFIGNGTSPSQFLAGNVAASQKFGASGLVMLKNGDDNGPVLSPLSVELGGAVSSSSSVGSPARRRAHTPTAGAWISHVKFSHLLKRQTTTTPSQVPLSAPLPASAPAVLAGAFWTNSSSSKEMTIIGGNFSFTAPGSSTLSTGVAIYDPNASTIQALSGSQINGTVRALLVDGNSLYVGGEFTIPGATVNGLALYDLSKNEWDVDGIQSLQGNAGSAVVVRSISKSTTKPTLLIVAGSFAQAGSLRCQAICSLDTSSKQWNSLGSGIQGEVSTVVYANNQNTLVAAGSLALSDNTQSNVLQYTFENSTWTSVGVGSDIPGPISALEVNSGNASSLFAAGKSSDGSTSFLSFWNGQKWNTLGSTFQEGTTVAQLLMVPLQGSHSSNNGVIEGDRVLMISGSLSTSSGNASSALFDGQSVIPYIVSTSADGSTGSVSSLFHSFASFSFNQRRFLATGVVILISIAIAAGVVFLLALIGILWTLFSRKEDKLNKYDAAEEEDDDSTHHRPSSLLEHINAATRTTIMGTSPYSNYNSEKEEQVTSSPHAEQDPFVGPDASNYIRAETPSDAVGGLLGEERSRPAHARYSFDGTGEGELPMSSGADIEVLDDRDPAWWFARDVRTGQEGVVPAAYLY